MYTNIYRLAHLGLTLAPVLLPIYRQVPSPHSSIPSLSHQSAPSRHQSALHTHSVIAHTPTIHQHLTAGQVVDPHRAGHTGHHASQRGTVRVWHGLTISVFDTRFISLTAQWAEGGLTGEHQGNRRQSLQQVAPGCGSAELSVGYRLAYTIAHHHGVVHSGRGASQQKIGYLLSTTLTLPSLCTETWISIFTAR